MVVKERNHNIGRVGSHQKNLTTNHFLPDSPVQNKKMTACSFQTGTNIDHLIFVQLLRKQSHKETILKSFQGIALSFLTNSVHGLGMVNILSNSVAVLNAKFLGGKMFNEKAFKGKGNG